jgi:hypothetical protein
MVGLLGRVISPSQGLYHNTERQGTNIHALSGIRTHDPSNQPAKTHTSDHTATVTGNNVLTDINCINTFYIALVLKFFYKQSDLGKSL